MPQDHEDFWELPVPRRSEALESDAWVMTPCYIGDEECVEDGDNTVEGIWCGEKFIAFDMLWHKGVDVRFETAQSRRARLLSWVDEVENVVPEEWVENNKEQRLRVLIREGTKGLVFKNTQAPYFCVPPQRPLYACRTDVVRSFIFGCDKNGVLMASKTLDGNLVVICRLEDVPGMVDGNLSPKHALKAARIKLFGFPHTKYTKFMEWTEERPENCVVDFTCIQEKIEYIYCVPWNRGIAEAEAFQVDLYDKAMGKRFLIL